MITVKPTHAELDLDKKQSVSRRESLNRVVRSANMVNFLSAFIGLSGFFKTSKDSKIKIDNFGFKLHYRFTAGFLFLSTAFCGMSEIFGKNIQCQYNGVRFNFHFLGRLSK